MLKNRDELPAHFTLHAPAHPLEVAKAQAALGFALPPDYVELLMMTDGLSSAGSLVLLEVADLAPRNIDYEVAEYLPGYVMIGDDSGGVAIVMKLQEPAVYEVDMGVLSAADLRKSADSLEQLLVDFDGKTLRERQEKLA